MTEINSTHLAPNLLPDDFNTVTSSPAKITLYTDPTGGHWKRIYVPVTADTVSTIKQRAVTKEIELEVVPLPDEDFRVSEMTWLQQNQHTLIAKYPGEWIAVDGNELVAHSGNLAELMSLAIAAGHPDPFVTAVPSERTSGLYV